MKGNQYQLDTFSWPVHIVYWSLSVVGWVLLIFIFAGDPWEAFINKVAYLPSQMIVAYGLVYLVIPQVANGSYIKMIAWFLGLSYVATVLARILKVYFYESVLGDDLEKNPILEIATELLPLLGQYVIWCFLLPIITVTILVVLQHLRQKAEIAELLKEKNLAELNVLKAQVHPHFLFNTLNNLYTLALQKSPQTTEIAGKLHDILDYMFNKYENSSVGVHDEIALIKNYVALERIRYGDRLRLDIAIDVDDDNFHLAPLLLLSLVENAFKHGASKDMSTPWIKISMTVKNNQLSFEVWNTKPDNRDQSAIDINSGIGLTNIRKQLLLLYPDKHSIEIVDREEDYSVTCVLRGSIENNGAL